MPCPEGKHDFVAVNPFVHPTEKDSKGEPLEIIGAPPQSEEEPAWCIRCGSLRSKRPTFFGMGGGWGLRHHDSDKDAPTLGNMLRDSEKAKKMRAYLAMTVAVVSARYFSPLSEQAEAEIAELQDEIWQTMPDLSRRVLEMQVEKIKEEWPSDA